MKVEKKVLLQKLLNQGIKPPSENFATVVLSLLKDKLIELVDITRVHPTTLEKVDYAAARFKHDMLSLWRSRQVSNMCVVKLILNIGI